MNNDAVCMNNDAVLIDRTEDPRFHSQVRFSFFMLFFMLFFIHAVFHAVFQAFCTVV